MKNIKTKIIENPFVAKSKNLLGLVVGQTSCVCCGAPSVCMPLCSNCKEKLLNFISFSKEARCKKCGKILISEKDICMQCRKECVVQNLDALYPLYMYRGWKKDLVFAWKMNEQRLFSPLFAHFLHNALVSVNKEMLPIIPVPPRPGKIKEKGWDQVEDLCNFLQKNYAHKICRILYRTTTGQQKKLNRAGRLGELGAKYALSTKRSFIKKKSIIIPESAILLDDIVTTGATMSSCAKILKEGGVKKVFGLSLFMVD